MTVHTGRYQLPSKTEMGGHDFIIMPCLAVKEAPNLVLQAATGEWKYLLEVIRSLLPGPVALNPNLYASEYHLFSATKVDT